MLELFGEPSSEPGPPGSPVPADDKSLNARMAPKVQALVAHFDDPRAERARLYYSEEMRERLLAVLRGAQESVQLCQYCFDDIEVVQLLCQAVRRGVAVQLVVDALQTNNPSCQLQPQRLLELVEWDMKVRAIRSPLPRPP